MKKIEIKKQLTDVKITTTFCDKCNKEIKGERYNAFDCEISLMVGEYYPYDGSHCGDNYTVDLCEDCAKFLFLDILPNNGINVVNEDD